MWWLRPLTCVVVETLAGEAALVAVADAVSAAGFGVAQIDLRLAVVSREAERTAAAQACDRVDRPEQDGVGRHERRQAVELQHGHALHVVLARLAQADVVVEREHLLRGDLRQQTAVQIQALLQLLRPQELHLASAAATQPGRADPAAS